MAAVMAVLVVAVRLLTAMVAVMVGFVMMTMAVVLGIVTMVGALRQLLLLQLRQQAAEPGAGWLQGVSLRVSPGTATPVVC